MIKITAKHPSWIGLQLTINGKPMTITETGLVLESIPRDVQAKIDTYVRMGVIALEYPKSKESHEKTNDDPKEIEDHKFKKGGK